MLRKTFPLTCLIIMLIGITFSLFSARPIKASGTIYIRADGSISPTTAPISCSGNVYSFTGDINGSDGVFVNRSNIVIDGNGYILKGGGFCLNQVEYVTVKNTRIMNCGVAIYLHGASHNKIFNNELEDSLFGIKLYGPSSEAGADENRIYDNRIINISLTTLYVSYRASGNIIYHNNFVGGIPKGQNYPNILDDSYPSGGNYWSNYEGIDVKKGPDQDQHGSDGIGDTPYIIDHANRDRYPLITPFGSPQPPDYTLTISAVSHGTTDPAPGDYTYSRRQNVSAEAIPSTGYALDHWELDEVNIGGSNPINVMMNANHTLRPVFLPAYTLTTTTTIGGRTDPEPGVHTYTDGTKVSVTALPDSGYCFDHWEVDGVNNSTNPMTVIINTDRALHAVFAQIQYTLTITTTTGGNTNPLPGTYTYVTGTSVSVIKSPSPGYYLDRWELDNTNIGIPNQVEITMNVNHTLHAVYRQLSLGHDIAAKGITSKTVVGRGYISKISATIINIGSYTETFNVTVYANTTIIDTIEGITLESGNSTILHFIWNTTSSAKGNYNISGYVDPVPDEVNITDNNYTDGWIIIAMVGDIDGPEGFPDGKCDMRDIGLVARYFGQTAPPAPANCDLTGPTPCVPDGKVDMRDIGNVARHFGETDP